MRVVRNLNLEENKKLERLLENEEFLLELIEHHKSKNRADEIFSKIFNNVLAISSVAICIAGIGYFLFNSGFTL